MLSYTWVSAPSCPPYVGRDNIYKLAELHRHSPCPLPSVAYQKGRINVKGAHLLLCLAHCLAQDRQLHIFPAQPISGRVTGRSTMAAFASEVRRELGVCGIATIPNQVHHLVSYSSIKFNVLLMGRAVGLPL